jgi:hypothetical protein
MFLMPKEQESTKEKTAAAPKTKPTKSSTRSTKPASAGSSAASKKRSATGSSEKPAATRPRKVAAPALNPDAEASVGVSDLTNGQSAESILHEHICVRAYYLAEELRACGEQWDSERIWLEAERQIRAGTGH